MIVRNLRNADSGSVMVEAAIIFSALLFLLVGIFEFGMAYWQWNTMTFAVEHAGRYMMVSDNTCSSTTCATDAENCMRGKVSSLPGGNSPVCTSTSQIAWISNPPPVCGAIGGVPATPSAGSACVYAIPTTTGTPPTPAVTLIAQYNMDWTVLQALASLFTSTLNGPVIEAHVTVPLD